MKRDFFYHFKDFNGSASLVIHHLGDSTIDNAVAEIEQIEKLDLRYRFIVFKTSIGTWDAYNARRKQIIHLQEDNWPVALESLYNYTLLKAKHTIIPH